MTLLRTLNLTVNTNPTQFVAAKELLGMLFHVLFYLKKLSDWKLTFNKQGTTYGVNDLVACCDSVYAGDVQDQKH